jgi:hypothetical protein
MEEHKLSCNLPHIDDVRSGKINLDDKQIDRTELERLGIPYKISKKGEDTQEVKQDEEEVN